MDIKDKCDRMMKIAMDINKKMMDAILKDIEPSLSKSHVYLLAYIRCDGECTVTDIVNYLVNT